MFTGALLVFIAALPSTTWAESMSLNQCANGGIAAMVSHEECHEGWINGNLNAQKAAYAEGEFVPYRVRLTGLSPGSTYTYEFSWDTYKDGKHALDYIGSYNASVSLADACDGAAAPCPGTTDTIAIPPDPSLPGGFPQAAGVITIFGGTFNSIGPYLNISPDVQGIAVTFTPDQPNAVIAWGGHIASPVDWGVGAETASDIKGSPYHTSNVALKNSLGQTVASGGQDVQLSAAAVFVPSVINVTKVSNAPGLFTFESAIDGAPIVPDDEVDGANPWTLTQGQTRIVDAMDEGTVTIQETSLPGAMWRIKAIMCEKLGTGTVFSYTYQEGQPQEDTAVFEVDEASTFNCTFENEFFGQPVLLVIKKVIPADQACTNAIRDSADNEVLSVRSGETVRYCMWVTNTGGDAAVDVTMVDDQANLLPGDVNIPLSGYTDEDGDLSADDLAIGGWLSGSLDLAINTPLNTQAINTATASGWGLTLGDPVSDSDTAQVNTNIESVCTVTGGAFAGAGDCDGDAAPTAYVIEGEGTSVTWCADLGWDANAVLDLINVVATEKGTALIANGSNLSPGGSEHIAVGSTVPSGDVTRDIEVTGSEGGLNPIACEGSASVNMLAPGLILLKLASTDGECFDEDGTDGASIEIINGDPVWYCLRVMNTGDSDLVDVTIEDNQIPASPWNVGDLDVGETVTLPPQGPYYPSEDVTNVAEADGIEPLTGFPVDDISQAMVEVLRADVEVDKSVDLDHIVICDGVDDPPDCTPTNPSGNYDATYTIIVTNNGPDVATGVTVIDELPVGFIYAGDDSGGDCAYDALGHLLTCDLGDMAPAESRTIEVVGEIDASLFDLPWQNVTNQACANTDPANLDPEPGNNCDQATTSISTGPTRTIGWWGTHPNGIAQCVLDSGGQIDLGYVVLRDEGFDGDVDATVSTDTSLKGKNRSSLIGAVLLDDVDGDATSAEVMVKGMLNASVSRWRDGTQRSRIGQARATASRQLTAAWCNETVFLADFDEYVIPWSDIRAILAGNAYLEEGLVVFCDESPCAKKDLDKVIESIYWLNGIADLFNNAGDDLPIPLPPEPAQPHAPEDDPTDPSN